MNAPSDERTQELVRETARLMGDLFIARRDVKAVYRPDRKGDWHWTRVDAPYKMRDFQEHLLGQECLGTYLLDRDSNVKFLAFDIDVRKEGKYWRIYEINEILTLEEQGYGFDMDLHDGPLEAALHDPIANAHPWVRIVLKECMRFITDALTELGLPSLTVITGGGAHVLAPFPEPQPAQEVRLVGLDIAANLPATVRRNEMFFDHGALSELSIEVFPKQDAITPDGYGNLLRLPFGWHHEADIRTYSIDPTAPTSPVWEWRKVSSIEALRTLAGEPTTPLQS